MTSTDKDIKSATKSKGPLTAATQAVRAEIASILKIDVDRSQWEVTDSIPEKGLYMVHYTDGADMTKYGHVRGTVIDVERKYVVAKSFGFSPIATISSLAASAGGDLAVKDDTGNSHDFKAGNYSLRRGFEGVILRIFKHDGVVYTATHRRLNIEKSRWGNSIPFIQMYKDLKGPEPDSLFDKTKAFSPYCWVFIITHPELLVGTKQNVGPGYVVLLGVETMFDASSKPEAVKVDDYQTVYQLPVMQEESTLNSVVADTKSGDGKDAKSGDSKARVFHPTPLTLVQANNHLLNGWFTEAAGDNKVHDKRLGLGEFVIIYGYDIPIGQAGSNKITRLLRVQSPSYSWRTTLRNDDQNMKHRYYELSNTANIDTSKKIGEEKFYKQFIRMPLYDVADIEDAVRNDPLLILTDEDPTTATSYDERMHTIWLNFLISLPPQQQQKALGFYTGFEGEISYIKERLVKLLSSELNEKEAASLNAPLDTLYKHYGKTSSNFNAGAVSGQSSVAKRASDIVGVNRGAKLYKLYASLKRYERDLTTPRKIATPVLPVSATVPAVSTVPAVTPSVNSVWSGKIPVTINKSS